MSRPVCEDSHPVVSSTLIELTIHLDLTECNHSLDENVCTDGMVAVYTVPSINTSPVFICAQPICMKKPARIVIPQVARACSLLFVWYEWCDTNGIKSLKLQGVADWSHYQQTPPWPIRDLNGDIQGQIRATGMYPIRLGLYMQTRRDARATQDAVQAMYHDEVYTRYDRLIAAGVSCTYRFSYVSTHNGPIPMTAYVQICNRIQYDDRNAERLFTRLFQVASFLVGRYADAAAFASATDKVKALYISHMVGLMQRTMIYHPDMTRNDKKPFDQWSRLFTSPLPFRTANDCEDGSLSILELIYVLRKANFQSVVLQQVQLHLNKYTPFLAIGEMPRDPDSFHVYVLMLDSKGVDDRKLPSESLLPPILLESTADVHPLWMDDEKFPYISPKLWYAKAHKSGLTLYGPLHVLVTTQHTSRDEARHFICHSVPDHRWSSSDMTKRVGVDLLRVVTGLGWKTTSCVKQTQEQFDQSVMRHIDQTQLPVSRLPIMSDASNWQPPTHLNRKNIQFTMSKYAYDTKHPLAKSGGETTTVVRLCDNLELVWV